MLTNSFIFGLRAKVLAEAFKGKDLPNKLKSFFESPHARLRNNVFHGIPVLKPSEIQKVIPDAEVVLEAAKQGAMATTLGKAR